MGAYFIIVNPARRQYFDPGRFGEANKFTSFLREDYALFVLKLLISDCYPRQGSAFPGAWLGEPVIFASDDTGILDPAGLPTATVDNPGRNLHALARAEYVDITYRALAELCRYHGMAKALAARAKDDPYVLTDLGATQDQYHIPALEAALDEAIGKPWRRSYQEVLAGATYYAPLPAIDWPL